MTRQKEEFVPIREGKAGIYVCGPTVYDLIHIGNARPMIVFDTLRRYLEYRGYEVNYVSNFTDVDDKIIKRANEEGVDASAISERYIAEARKDMHDMNVREATVHPKATEEIPDMIQMVQTLIDKGYAYEVNGTVYFRTRRFQDYGKLSHKNLDDLRSGNRELKVSGQEEKEDNLDFVLWKPKKEGEPFWESPWGEGRPGWHLECSTMSEKYLGETFDIHGGGLDLLFPHHECEIAQSVAAQGHETVNYWVHNNMITINGKKMGKSYNNFIKLEEFFNGSHPLLEQPYSPMVIRFFILQAQYRSTVDFSNAALQAAEKALQKITDGYRRLQNLLPSEKSSVVMPDFLSACYEAMDDDLNTPQVIAQLFEACKIINAASDGLTKLSQDDIAKLRHLFDVFLIEILGMKIGAENDNASATKAYEGAVDLLMEIRKNAKAQKDWATSDLIRDKLASLGFDVKDTKNGVEWSLKQ